MKFKFKGNEYTYDELKNANVTLIVDICNSLNMDYKYYAPFLYKNRDTIIEELFSRQAVNDFEENLKKDFDDNEKFNAKKEKYNSKDDVNDESIEHEINRFFTDISKIDIGSIFENVNDAIININQDDVINKGSKFAHDVVKGFEKFVEESVKEETNTKKYKNRHEENYIQILSLEENEYNYNLKNKFVSAFRRFRILDASQQRVLVVKKIDDQLKLEKVTFNFDTEEDILNVKCEVNSNNIDINDDVFDFIFLEDEINDTLIKSVINLISNLKVEMLEDNEIIREINLINEYINNGEINILLGFKNPEEVLENKIVFYENVKGESQIIIDENKDRCDVRRIKTAKSLKVFIKSNLSQQKTEVINIDLTNLKVNIASEAEYERYKKISEMDLIISFKKIDNDKLSYRIFLKENGRLMHSDKFITLY